MPPVAISPSSKYLPNWVSGAVVRSFIAAQDSRPAIALALAVWLVGCADNLDWIDARIEIRRPTATTCQLDRRAGLTVHALGDFPPSGATVETLDPLQGVLSVDRFPVDTRYLRFVQGSPEVLAGAAIKLLPRASPQRALLLPLGRSCPSPDFEARAREGAAVASLPDGSLLIAGGRNDDFGEQSDGAAVSTALLLPAGSELVDQVEGGMVLRRSGATATLLGDDVLVIGGAAHDRGPAHDTFETFDLVTSRFSVSTSSELVHGPRRDHAAIALADGSGVLIVGGVAELGDVPMSSAELVTVSGAQDVAGMTVGRSHPSLHALSDGRVLIVGGVDVDANAVGSIEEFDPQTQRISLLAETFTTNDRAVSASLLGDRVASLGCGGVGCSLSVLQRTDRGDRVIDVALNLPTLTRAQIVGLSDGTLLVVGQRRLSDLAEAWRVDFGAGTIDELTASRAPSTLHVLADGTVAELDESGLSLRRDRIVTPFDNPPATLLVDDQELALDVSTHWARVSERVIARVDDARLDVAGLVFGSFVARLDLEVPAISTATLRLVGAGRSTDIVVSGTTVSIGSCNVERSTTSQSIAIERRDHQLTLRSGDNTMQCAADLSDHISLAVIADRDCGIGPIQMTRL